MNDWLIEQGITNPQMGLVLGLAMGLFAVVIVAWTFSRRNAVLETRVADRDQHYQEQIRKLEEAEQRLARTSNAWPAGFSRSARRSCPTSTPSNWMPSSSPCRRK